VDLSGAVLLTKPDTEERHVRQQLTKLIRVGGKLAVLGVEDSPTSAMGWWHVARPGSHGAPQGNSWEPDQDGANLVHGKSLCGRTIVTNGYAADWRPPDGVLCPGCREQI
jgi:hypothetical protein